MSDFELTYDLLKFGRSQIIIAPTCGNNPLSLVIHLLLSGMSLGAFNVEMLGFQVDFWKYLLDFLQNFESIGSWSC